MTAKWSPDDHRPSLVLELVHRENGGWFCLACSQPWPCETERAS